jgi:hypothetical protein
MPQLLYIFVAKKVVLHVSSRKSWVGTDELYGQC